MRLQYQLSNGDWIDCGERTDEFLDRCAKYNTGITTRDEVLAALSTGKILRNDSVDWYSKCRDAEAIERIRQERSEQIDMVKCSCGHTIPRTAVMNASMGTSCINCYDRMSY